MNKFLPGALILFVFLGSGAGFATATGQKPSFYNGFEVEGGLIAPNEIDHGGPGRDGIPALDYPVFLEGAARASEIKPADRVMGVSYNGVSKAYPILILDQHEIVNDTFALTPLTITFCPLCGTGMVFQAEADGQVLNFGVSGLIYNSDMLLYDRNTKSLWSQVMKKAVTGPLKGTDLTQVPAQYTTWAAWSQQHPDSLLLSKDTGFERNYATSPYEDYKRLPAVKFATMHSDWRLSAKTWVIGITAGDQALALPFEALDKLEEPLMVTVGGEPLKIQWDKAASAAQAFDKAGKEFPVTASYWFAWVAFHPTTLLYPFESEDLN
jgi:hypothetical protein